MHEHPLSFYENSVYICKSVEIEHSNGLSGLPQLICNLTDQ